MDFQGHLTAAYNLLKKEPLVFILGGLTVHLLAGVSLGLLAGPLIGGYLLAMILCQRDNVIPEFNDIFTGLQRLGALFLFFLLHHHDRLHAAGGAGRHLCHLVALHPAAHGGKAWSFPQAMRAIAGRKKAFPAPGLSIHDRCVPALVVNLPPHPASQHSSFAVAAGPNRLL
jgi:hypothetical protein